MVYFNEHILHIGEDRILINKKGLCEKEKLQWEVIMFALKGRNDKVEIYELQTCQKAYFFIKGYSLNRTEILLLFQNMLHIYNVEKNKKSVIIGLNNDEVLDFVFFKGNIIYIKENCMSIFRGSVKGEKTVLLNLKEKPQSISLCNFKNVLAICTKNRLFFLKVLVFKDKTLIVRNTNMSIPFKNKKAKYTYHSHKNDVCKNKRNYTEVIHVCAYLANNIILYKYLKTGRSLDKKEVLKLSIEEFKGEHIKGAFFFEVNETYIEKEEECMVEKYEKTEKKDKELGMIKTEKEENNHNVSDNNNNIVFTNILEGEEKQKKMQSADIESNEKIIEVDTNEQRNKKTMEGCDINTHEASLLENNTEEKKFGSKGSSERELNNLLHSNLTEKNLKREIKSEYVCKYATTNNDVNNKYCERKKKKIEGKREKEDIGHYSRLYLTLCSEQGKVLIYYIESLDAEHIEPGFTKFEKQSVASFQMHNNVFDINDMTVTLRKRAAKQLKIITQKKKTSKKYEQYLNYMKQKNKCLSNYSFFQFFYWCKNCIKTYTVQMPNEILLESLNSRKKEKLEETEETEETEKTGSSKTVMLQLIDCDNKLLAIKPLEDKKEKQNIVREILKESNFSYCSDSDSYIESDVTWKESGTYSVDSLSTDFDAVDVIEKNDNLQMATKEEIKKSSYIEKLLDCELNDIVNKKTQLKGDLNDKTTLEHLVTNECDRVKVKKEPIEESSNAIQYEDTEKEKEEVEEQEQEKEKVEEPENIIENKEEKPEQEDKKEKGESLEKEKEEEEKEKEEISGEETKEESYKYENDKEESGEEENDKEESGEEENDKEESGEKENDKEESGEKENDKEESGEEENDKEESGEEENDKGESGEEDSGEEDSGEEDSDEEESDEEENDERENDKEENDKENDKEETEEKKKDKEEENVSEQNSIEAMKNIKKKKGMENVMKENGISINENTIVKNNYKKNENVETSEQIERIEKDMEMNKTIDIENDQQFNILKEDNVAVCENTEEDSEKNEKIKNGKNSNLFDTPLEETNFKESPTFGISKNYSNSKSICDSTVFTGSISLSVSTVSNENCEFSEIQENVIKEGKENLEKGMVELTEESEDDATRESEVTNFEGNDEKKNIYIKNNNTCNKDKKKKKNVNGLKNETINEEEKNGNKDEACINENLAISHRKKEKEEMGNKKKAIDIESYKEETLEYAESSIKNKICFENSNKDKTKNADAKESEQKYAKNGVKKKCKKSREKDTDENIKQGEHKGDEESKNEKKREDNNNSQSQTWSRKNGNGESSDDKSNNNKNSDENDESCDGEQSDEGKIKMQDEGKQESMQKQKKQKNCETEKQLQKKKQMKIEKEEILRNDVMKDDVEKEIKIKRKKENKKEDVNTDKNIETKRRKIQIVTSLNEEVSDTTKEKLLVSSGVSEKKSSTLENKFYEKVEISTDNIEKFDLTKSEKCMSLISTIKLNLSLSNYNELSFILRNKDVDIIKKTVKSLGKKCAMKLFDYILFVLSEKKHLIFEYYVWIVAICNIYKEKLKGKKYTGLVNKFSFLVNHCCLLEPAVTSLIEKVNLMLQRFDENQELDDTKVINYYDGALKK